MAVRDWSAPRMRRFWLRGLVAELTLIAVIVVIGRATRPAQPPLLRQMDAITDSQARGLLPPPKKLTSAEFRQLLHDSLGLDVVHQGNTVHLVPSTARADSVIRTVGRFGAALGDAVRAVVWVLAVVLLPIPLAMVAVTLYWGWGRWRRSSVPGPA